MREPSAELIIDIDRIRNNIIYLKSLLKPDTKFMAILKANAYGHGLNIISKSIDDLVDGYGLVRLEEATSVRKYTSKKILLMQGVYSEDDFKIAYDNKFDLVVHNKNQLFAFENSDINIWLKVNTGMNRLGFLPEEIISLHKLYDLDKRKYVLMSHLACSDNPKDQLNEKQFKLFDQLADSLEANFEKSIGNTGCILNFPDQCFDWVRSGIGLYGGVLGNKKLKSAMTFRSKIIEIRNIKQNDRVGYNGRVIAKKDMKIAIVYAGYADGFPQSIKDNSKVVINDQVAQIFGQVSMDLISIDVTNISNCNIGDWCILWNEKNTHTKIAKDSNLISYELMTRITPRVKVIYENL